MKCRSFIWLSVVLVVAGCASVNRTPPPPHIAANAIIPGLPQARFWGDVASPLVAMRMEKLRKQLNAQVDVDKSMDQHFLAISGGGQKGAFGAGLLTGWTVSGTRPQFRMVTGISTGSLLAPFAFLGPEYDQSMEDMYTKFSTKDVLETRYWNGLVSGDSITDNSPLRKIVETYFSPKEMQLVADEYNKGRRLFIGTTNLDMQRPVIWDIGAIAASGHPQAYSLIIDTMLASAAIPGAFPPIYFHVEHNNVVYDEMHVDGGVTAQVFVCPTSFSMGSAMHELGFTGKGHVYVIRNALNMPNIETVHPYTLSILAQSLTALIRAQGLGDIERIYLTAKLENMSFQTAHIPDGFTEESDEIFDISYMTDLFEYAYKLAAEGYPWLTKPPSM